jgi:hypothetical protein
MWLVTDVYHSATQPKKRLHALNPFIKVSAREQVELRNHVDFMGMKLDKVCAIPGLLSNSVSHLSFSATSIIWN